MITKIKNVDIIKVFLRLNLDSINDNKKTPKKETVITTRNILRKDK